jgi:hypothetical protein
MVGEPTGQTGPLGGEEIFHQKRQPIRRIGDGRIPAGVLAGARGDHRVDIGVGQPRQPVHLGSGPVEAGQQPRPVPVAVAAGQPCHDRTS